MSSSAVVLALRRPKEHRVPRLPPVTAPHAAGSEGGAANAAAVALPAKKRHVLQFPVQGLASAQIDVHPKQAGFYNVRWRAGSFDPPQYPPSVAPPAPLPDPHRHKVYAHNHPGPEQRARDFRAKAKAAEARLRAVQQKMATRQDAILTTQKKQQRQRYARLQAKGIMNGSSPTKASGAFLCR